MTSHARESIIRESKFYKDLSDNLGSNNAFSEQGKFKIKEMRIGVDQTRLFNDEFVQWGVLTMESDQ